MGIGLERWPSGLLVPRARGMTKIAFAKGKLRVRCRKNDLLDFRTELVPIGLIRGGQFVPLGAVQALTTLLVGIDQDRVDRWVNGIFRTIHMVTIHAE